MLACGELSLQEFVDLANNLQWPLDRCRVFVDIDYDVSCSSLMYCGELIDVWTYDDGTICIQRFDANQKFLKKQTLHLSDDVDFSLVDLSI